MIKGGKNGVNYAEYDFSRLNGYKKKDFDDVFTTFCFDSAWKPFRLQLIFLNSGLWTIKFVGKACLLTV